MTIPMIDFALQYAGRGWRVFPVGQNKKPLIKWKEGATVSPSVIESWWSPTHGRWPHANIGIATGTPSGICVVDIDSPAALGRFLAKHGNDWAKHPVPPTAVVCTGRGWHLYVDLDPGRVVKCSVGKGDEEGIDIRGEGGYVLAPPSIHPSGRIYEWNFRLLDGSAYPPLFDLAETPANSDK